MSFQGMKSYQDIFPGYSPRFAKPEDFQHLAMANWDYERCDNGQIPFGPDWDYQYSSLGSGESFEEGPGYKYRYWERYFVTETLWFEDDTDWDVGQYIVCIWHYAEEPGDWNAIVCTSSVIDFGPDPWASGKLSERQSGALSYKEWDDYHHNKWGTAYGSASLGAIVGTYSYAADQASWQEALYGPLSSGSARFNDYLGSSERAGWQTGARRDFTAGIDEVWHYYKASGIGFWGTLDRVNNPLNFPDGVYGEDYAPFPGTWLGPNGFGYWMWDGNPVVVAAGLKFGIQMIPSGFDEDVIPGTAVARLEFEPSNYEFVDADSISSPDTHIRTDPGGGSYIDFEMETYGESFIGHSGTLDYTMRSVGYNAQFGHHIFDVEIPYIRDMFAATITGANVEYADVIPKIHQFIDPVYSWTGNPPPWGGGGTSGITAYDAKLYWRYNGRPHLWVEVQWPDYYYWIPGGCPPHLRINQRQDVALGQRGNVPTTSACNKALRLIGRGEVDQNLTPGKSPRVYLPNSYF